MSHAARAGFTPVAVVVAIAALGLAVHTQQTQLPNPYRLVEGWPALPKNMNGGRWGELIRADLDPKGNIWVFHRCFNTVPAGAATCVGRSEPPILQFDPSGRLLTSFGAGMFAFPHGFTIDGEGNVWASDANGDETVLGMSARGSNGLMRGQQVFKFSPAGKVLMTLGKAGVAGNGPDTFDRPSGVAVAANGDIFVTDGHGKNDRVVKFSKDGRFIKAWGRHGAGPGEFDQPHDISIGGSQGRVFVADRENNRVQIFDQDGNFIAAWKQFGRPSAVFVSKDDTLYVSDSQSNSKVNPSATRGITVGSAKDGSLSAFIPDPDLGQADVNRISGASGITADDMGTIYAADVGTHKLRKYVKVLAFAQAELRVFVAGAMTEPVKEAGAAFARSSGHTLVYLSDTTGGLQKRLAAGERADVVVVTSPAMDTLQKDNRVVAGSRVDLARALIGVGVRAGAPSPDLSTTDMFKAALLKARSVSYVNPASGGASGTYFEGLMQRMGIADAMKAKIVYRTQGSEVADAVAKGEAELGITFTSELQPNKGVKVAGTLPAAIQLPTIYSAAIATTAGSGDAARAFLRALAGAEGRAALTTAGLEPLAPAR